MHVTTSCVVTVCLEKCSQMSVIARRKCEAQDQELKTKMRTINTEHNNTVIKVIE